VNPGEISVLVGPSGCGKSTLIRSLALLDLPDEGKIEVDNISYNFPFPPDKEFIKPWPKITVVFQQLFLWPHLTVRGNITLALKTAMSNGIENRYEEYITRFGLNDLSNRYPNQLSIGQRQRVAIVRALVLKPKYLLLDEITSALDVQHINRLMEDMKEIRNEGTGILLVTHLIGMAKQIGQQVYFMDQGRIIEQGGAESLRQPKTEGLRKFLSIVDV